MTAPSGAGPGPTWIGSREFRWGERTYVMGIVNATPDSFSGDGLFVAGEETDAVLIRAVEQARRMADDGADILDIGGESTRPGHREVTAEDEIARVVPIVAAIRRALPGMPISVDTTKAAVAAAALDSGADLINDVWGVARRTGILDLAAARRVPVVLMHNRLVARYTDLLAEVVADLAEAVERAVAAGVPRSSVIVDPGFGFGKTPLDNVALLRGLGALRSLGRPILLGTSRKSTLGRILDEPPDERLEATLATTALGIASGVDMIRVHDVGPNVRAARTADAIVRGTADGRLASSS